MDVRVSIFERYFIYFLFVDVVAFLLFFVISGLEMRCRISSQLFRTLLSAVSQALLERAKMGPRYHAGIRQAGAEHLFHTTSLDSSHMLLDIIGYQLYIYLWCSCWRSFPGFFLSSSNEFSWVFFSGIAKHFRTI